MTIRRAEINYEDSKQADELRKIRARQERRDGERGAHMANGSSVARHDAALQPAPAPSFEHAQRSASSTDGGALRGAPREAGGMGRERMPPPQNSGAERKGEGAVARMIREREELASKQLPASPSRVVAHEHERRTESPRAHADPGIRRVPAAAATRAAAPDSAQPAVRSGTRGHQPGLHADLPASKPRADSADTGGTRADAGAHTQVGPYQVQGAMHGSSGRGVGDQDSSIEQVAALARQVSSRVCVKR
jgi:hypothetical protein